MRRVKPKWVVLGFCIYLASYVAFTCGGRFQRDPDEMSNFAMYRSVWIPYGFALGSTWNYPLVVLYLPLYETDCLVWHRSHLVPNISAPLQPATNRPSAPSD